MLIWISVFAWAFLLFAWGGFWRADQRLVGSPAPTSWPDVAVVIPARNEAETIGAAVASHVASDYPGTCRVIVVDDASEDMTAQIACKGGAEVLSATVLPEGWSGKISAVKAGTAHVDHVLPDARWLLLTDADILHRPDLLRTLVSFGEMNGLAMVSLMARLDCRGFWGQLLIPAFVFFFQKLYPFPWVNRPRHWGAGAAGGCMLIRRSSLRDVGGMDAIHGALIDDCALAARLKHHPPGRGIWLGLAKDEVRSLRDNRSLRSIWNMVARTAFTQLGHSYLMLAGAVFGLGVLYLAPPIGLVWGIASGNSIGALAGAIGLALMVIAYAPTLRIYGLAPWRGLALPLAAALYLAMTVDSARREALGKGGQWKGRTYPRG